MQTTMLPSAGIYLKDFYDTTLEFIALRSPTFLIRSTDTSAICQQRSDTTQDCCACSCHSPPPSPSLPPMRRQLDVAKAESSRHHFQVATLEERCKSLEDALRETKEALRQKELLLLHLAGSIPKQNRRQSDASQKRRSLISAKSNSTDTDLDLASSPDQPCLITRFPDLSIAQEQSAHATSLEVFLTKTDMWSGAQIIQAVHDLNSEILQFAASASELHAYDRCVSPASSPGQQEITARLGPTLSRLLVTRDHTQDPILVQFALQGCISTLVSIALSSFCIGLQGKSNVILSTIYSHMANFEPQSTSSKWRALTHHHIHNLQPNLLEREVHELTETMLRLSSDVFQLSGCSGSSTAPSLCDSLRTHFGERVRRIARAVCKLAQITKEEILSTDLEVVAIDHSKPYDAKIMQNAFGEYGPSHGAVLCTTELGLRCTTRKSSSSESAKPDCQRPLERRLLLRPKVLLESVVDSLDPR